MSANLFPFLSQESSHNVCSTLAELVHYLTPRPFTERGIPEDGQMCFASTKDGRISGVFRYEIWDGGGWTGSGLNHPMSIAEMPIWAPLPNVSKKA